MSKISLWSFGVIAILLFHEGIYLPIVVSATVITLVAWYLILLYRQSRVGPLTMLLFVAYAFPFIQILLYIGFDFDVESPSLIWNLAANPYMGDKRIIELTSMIGAVGAVGFAAGSSLPQGKLSMGISGEDIIRYRPLGKTLSIPVFWIWIVTAIIFSWISAPADTIFISRYTQSASINANWNFSSAWMLSYAILMFTLADSMFEASPRTRKLKRKIFLYSILFVVVWFQLLRGDREILTLVLAAPLIYYVWGKDLVGSAKDRVKLKWPVIVLSVIGVLIAAAIVGTLRHSLVGVDNTSSLMNVLNDLGGADIIRFNNIITGTWIGVLLTPLSVAGDYINGSLSIKHGQTYLDLLLSIMPGFLADWMGYSRPIDSLRGPAWEMRYGLGGTHAVVVPFMNFSMAGVFIIVALWSFAFAKIERYSIKRLTVSNLALLGIIAMVIPHWLWYGEKYIINALIIWLMLSVSYRIRFVYRGVNSKEGSYQPFRSSF